MNIQAIQKKMFSLVLIILVLFCLVNCGKTDDTPEELKGLKKPIDFTSLTFNEAQEKLFNTYSPDFPKDSEIIISNNVRYIEIDKAIERYSIETEQGIKLSDNIVYFKKGTKTPFTGILIYPRLYATNEQMAITEEYIKNRRSEILNVVIEGYLANASEYYIKDGNEVLHIGYDSGKRYFNNENCLRLLNVVKVADNNGNEVYYRFLKNFVDINYAKEKGIPLEYDMCPQLRIAETVNGILVKHTYYYYDLDTGKFIAKYEEDLSGNLELAKKAKIVNREIIEDEKLISEKIFADNKK